MFPWQRAGHTCILCVLLTSSEKNGEKGEKGQERRRGENDTMKKSETAVYVHQTMAHRQELRRSTVKGFFCIPRHSTLSNNDTTRRNSTDLDCSTALYYVICLHVYISPTQRDLSVSVPRYLHFLNAPTSTDQYLQDNSISEMWPQFFLNRFQYCH